MLSSGLDKAFVAIVVRRFVQRIARCCQVFLTKLRSENWTTWSSQLDSDVVLFGRYLVENSARMTVQFFCTIFM